jgi:hypothetical protein
MGLYNKMKSGILGVICNLDFEEAMAMSTGSSTYISWGVLVLILNGGSGCLFVFPQLTFLSCLMVFQMVFVVALEAFTKGNCSHLSSSYFFFFYKSEKYIKKRRRVQPLVHRGVYKGELGEIGKKGEKIRKTYLPRGQPAHCPGEKGKKEKMEEFLNRPRGVLETSIVSLTPNTPHDT